MNKAGRGLNVLTATAARPVLSAHRYLLLWSTQLRDQHLRVSCLGQLMARTLFPFHVTASHGLRVWSWHESAA